MDWISKSQRSEIILLLLINCCLVFLRSTFPSIFFFLCMKFTFDFCVWSGAEYSWVPWYTDEDMIIRLNFNFHHHGMFVIPSVCLVAGLTFQSFSLADILHTPCAVSLVTRVLSWMCMSTRIEFVTSHVCITSPVHSYGIVWNWHYYSHVYLCSSGQSFTFVSVFLSTGLLATGAFGFVSFSCCCPKGSVINLCGLRK